MSTDRKTLKPGSFYWVVPVLDPEADEEWERGAQPARFIDTAGEHGERWHCLNVEGPSEWPMRSAGPEIQESQPWHPIDTAPKDGTVVLLYFPEQARSWDTTDVFLSPRILAGFRPSANGEWLLPEVGESIEGNASHWMPLPEAPAP